MSLDAQPMESSEFAVPFEELIPMNNNNNKNDISTLSVFLSGFGPRGGKTAICNLVGGHGSLNITLTIQICQFQGGARVSLGGANAPPRPPLKETL